MTRTHPTCQWVAWLGWQCSEASQDLKLDKLNIIDPHILILVSYRLSSARGFGNGLPVVMIVSESLPLALASLSFLRPGHFRNLFKPSRAYLILHNGQSMSTALTSANWHPKHPVETALHPSLTALNSSIIYFSLNSLALSCISNSRILTVRS